MRSEVKEPHRRNSSWAIEAYILWGISLEARPGLGTSHRSTYCFLKKLYKRRIDFGEQNLKGSSLIFLVCSSSLHSVSSFSVMQFQMSFARGPNGASTILSCFVALELDKESSGVCSSFRSSIMNCRKSCGETMGVKEMSLSMIVSKSSYNQ